jgi:hypothetical protein
MKTREQSDTGRSSTTCNVLLHRDRSCSMHCSSDSLLLPVPEHLGTEQKYMLLEGAESPLDAGYQESYLNAVPLFITRMYMTADQLATPTFLQT